MGKPSGGIEQKRVLVRLKHDHVCETKRPENEGYTVNGCDCASRALTDAINALRSLCLAGQRGPNGYDWIQANRVLERLSASPTNPRTQVNPPSVREEASND